MLLGNKEKKSAEIPTGSLADMAFLLLVFFLVTTTIDTDKGISLALPERGEQLEIRSTNIANVFINAAGDVMIDDEITPINRVKGKAQEMLNGNENLIFSVKTVAETKYDVYLDVVDQLKLANATKISIAEPEF